MRIFISIFLLAACEAPSEGDGPNDSFLVGGKADTSGVYEGSPEARAVLALVNRAAYDTLRNAVHLESRAALNIVAYREGDDTVAGTDDDQRFDALADLDAVPYAGPAAFENLLAYVRGGKGGQDGQSPSPYDWQAGWPASFSRYERVFYQSQLNPRCEPTCNDTYVGIGFGNNTGRPIVYFVSGIPDGYSVYTYPFHPVESDGSFSFSDEHAFPKWANHATDGAFESATISGHFEPGNVIVLDQLLVTTTELGKTWTLWNLAPARASYSF